MPRKMNITAKNGLKIEKMGSTSPKTRFLGHFYGLCGPPVGNFGKMKALNKAFHLTRRKRRDGER